jgi:hypothetical protein
MLIAGATVDRLLKASRCNPDPTTASASVLLHGGRRLARVYRPAMSGSYVVTGAGSHRCRPRRWPLDLEHLAGHGNAVAVDHDAEALRWTADGSAVDGLAAAHRCRRG